MVNKLINAAIIALFPTCVLFKTIVFCVLKQKEYLVTEITCAVKIGQVAGHNDGGWCSVYKKYWLFGPILAKVQNIPQLMSLDQADEIVRYWHNRDVGAEVRIHSLTAVEDF
jgi:hypothetical protein